MEDSIRKRLSLQKEVLNWLNEFSENLTNRANAVTLEVHQLLDQTDIVEQDMRNTLNSFRNLSYTRFVDNKISEDELSGFRNEENTKRRGQVISIPAQSYETDILPRYKEAVSLGLSSYHNHMQKTNRTSTTGSVFKTGLGCNPLPHIIGSAEYIHDNTCGLTEDFLSDTFTRDFSHLAKPKGGPSDAGMFGSDTIFNDLLGEQQSPSEKSGIEPVVSAASDFKAMLEAALLSPYKFYHDEGNSSLSETVDYKTTTVQMRAELDHVSYTLSDNDEVASPQHQTGITENTAPITSANLSSLKNFDAQIDKIPSALISESLFDAEEESLLSSIHETCETLSTINMSVHNDSEISVDVTNKEDIMHDSLFGDDDDANVKDNAPQSTSVSSPDDGNMVGASAVASDESDRLATHAAEDDKSPSVCTLPSQDGDGCGDHSEITDDPCCRHKDYSPEERMSSVQTVGGSLDGDDLSSCED